MLRRLCEKFRKHCPHPSENESDTVKSSVDIKIEQLEQLGIETVANIHDTESILSTSSGEFYQNGEFYASEEFYSDPNLEESAARLEDDSPYPEVRSAVANTDDPDMPCNTLRAWVIGMAAAIIIPGLNQFMYFRWPAVTVGQLVAQLLAYPMGRLWARAVPNATILGVSLNPGQFTVKEHVLITIMASVGCKSAYATDIVAVQRLYYNQNFSFSYQWLLVMSTQLIGFSIGGIGRRFLVAPPSMIWPANLVLCALFNTLHSQQYVGMGRRGGVSRERFFTYALLIATAYYFFPGYLFTALSMFTWVCWLAPKNRAAADVWSGMGMSILTFDWAQIAYIGSPLATPWWAAANVAAGFVIFFWILTPIIYFKNIWNSQYMPIMSRMAYDNTGMNYNTSRILTSEATFDADAYYAYSPLYLPAAFAISYGLSFASIAATITHTILYFRRQIHWQVFGKSAFREQPDIHARLMAAYEQVPDYWYLLIFLSMFAFGVVSVEVWPTQMPVWALVLALAIAAVYVIPIGMIQAITNQQIGLNVITELIVGYALPGKPVALMMFKTWGYITMSQALRFASDYKLGHYMKIPPKAMFWAQIAATAIAGTVQLAVQSWLFTNVHDICNQHQPDGFICPDTEVFYTASVLWGVIGPRLQFSKGQTYYPLMFFFLIGAVAPLIPYLIMKRYPNSIWRYVNVPLILGGTYLMPPATASNYVPWAFVAFVFQYYVRRRHFSWWAKYNYVLSAALDSGVTIGALLIFFALEFPTRTQNGYAIIENWWGNSVYKNTADWNYTALRALAPNATFGPSVW